MYRPVKIAITLVLLVLLALLGYVAAGPFLTADRIGEAVQAQDSAALAEEIDFPALRANLKAQIEDRLARRVGSDAQSSVLGALAVRIAGGVAGGAVDAMVTPAGIGALMEGRSFWERLGGERGSGGDGYGARPPSNPLHDAEYRFESTSRFTATVHDEAGRPVVFVLTRGGLDWKLSDIRLPPGDP